MKLRYWLPVAAFVAAACAPDLVSARDRLRWGTAPAAAAPSWHGPYVHTSYGAPVALVVPPSVKGYGSYTWGMPASHRHGLPDQFGRQGGYGAGSYEGGMYGTPYHPSSSHQFGVYYVRGPWW